MKNSYASKLISLIICIVFYTFLAQQLVAQTVNKDFNSPQYEKAIEGIVNSSNDKLTANDVRNILLNETSEEPITLSQDAAPTFIVNPLIYFVEFDGIDSAHFSYTCTEGDDGYALASISNSYTYNPDNFAQTPSIPSPPTLVGTIEVDVSQNENAEARFATLELTAKYTKTDNPDIDVVRVVYILQGPAPDGNYLFAIPEFKSISSSANNVPFAIITNAAAWSVAGSLPFEISATTSDDTVIFSVPQNTDPASRYATIQIVDDADDTNTDELTIIQAGSGPFITIIPQIQAVNYDVAITDKFNIIKYNIDEWEVGSILPNWLSIGDSSHTSSDQFIKFNLVQNESDVFRDTTIIIQEVGNPLVADTLTIYQGAQSVPSILITPQIQSFSYNAQTTDEFDIIHFNITDWEVGSNLPDWITIGENSHSDDPTDDYIKFELSQNTGNQVRDTIIIIQEEDNPDVADTLTIIQGNEATPQPYIYIDPYYHGIDYLGGITEPYNIIHPNVENWTVVVPSDGLPYGITIYEQDHDNDFITFYIPQNTGDNFRQASIRIQSSDNSAIFDSLHIVQGAYSVPSILVTPEIQSFSFESQTTEKFNIFQFNITDWEVGSTLPDWITVGENSHSGNNYIKFEIARNYRNQLRDTTIIIRDIDNPDVSDQIHIYQGAEAVSTVVVSPEIQAYPFNAVEETANFNVLNFNVGNWTAIIAPEDQSWVSVKTEVDDETNPNYITFSLTENDEQDFRDATIRIQSDEDNSVFDELTIYQGAEAVSTVVVSPEIQAYPFNAVEETANFNVLNFNVGNWTAIIAPEDQGWVSVKTEVDDENNPNYITFSLTENDEQDFRDATIRIQSDEDNSVFDELSIYQGAQSVSTILITPQIQSLAYNDIITEKFTIVHFNIDDWEVDLNSLPDWITIEDTIHSENPSADFVVFKLSVNETDSLRADSIIIQEIGNPLIADTLTIYQGAQSVSNILITPQIQSFSFEEQKSDKFDIINFNITGWELAPGTLPEWITVNFDDHDADTITFNVLLNTEDNYREDTIIIREIDNPDVADTLTIYQGAQSVSNILITPQIQSFSFEEQKSDKFDIINFNITGWELAPGTLPEWITVDFADHDADTIAFNVLLNTEDNYREDTIIIREIDNSDVADTLTIYQGAQSVSNILITPQIQSLSYMADTTDEFNIIHFNITDWEVGSILPDWISVGDSSHTGDDYIKFILTQNMRDQMRDTIIIIQELGNPLIADTLTIYQGSLSESVILITPEIQTLTYEAQTTEKFNIIHFNITDWEVDESTLPENGWITIGDSSHNGNDFIKFNITENDSVNILRADTITIQEKGNPLISDQLIIYQDAFPSSYILTAPRNQVIPWNYPVGLLPQPFVITPVNIANLQYELSFEPDTISDWLTTNGIINDTLKFTVQNLNDNPFSRIATIRIFDSENPTIDDTVRVQQYSDSEPYLILIPAAKDDLNSSGDKFSIKSYSNLKNYTARINEPDTSWIHFIAGQDSVFYVNLSLDTTVIVQVDSNFSAYSSRSSIVTFTNDTISELFFLSQNPAPLDTVFIEGTIGGIENPNDSVIIFADPAKGAMNADGSFKFWVPKGWKGRIIPKSTFSTHYFVPGQLEINTQTGLTVDTCCLNFEAYKINPMINITFDSIAICNEESLDLNTDELKPQVSGTYGEIIYKWIADPISNQNTISNDTILAPEFTTNSTTTYTLELTNTNITVSDAFVLIVKPLPEIRNFIGELSVCQNQAGIVYSVEEFSSADNFIWELPLGGKFVTNPNTNIAVVNWGNVPGSYPLLLTTIKDGCEALPYIGSITVLENANAPAPTSVYRKSDDNFLYCVDENADQYSWGWFSLKDSKIFGEPYYIPSRSDWYCRLPDGYSVDSDTNRYFVEIRHEGMECFSRSFYNVPVNINERETDHIIVFPNPTDNVINIKLDENSISSEVKVKIYDFIGNLVVDKSYSKLNSTTLTIDEARYFDAGIYLINIQLDSRFFTTKIIVR